MHNALGIVDDPIFLEHRAFGPHPERPERLDAARNAVQHADITLPRRSLPPRDATLDELNRVHTSQYLELLQRAQGKSGHFDADTFYGPRSVGAALRAAGGAIELTRSLQAGDIAYGIALLRPPGHHARPHTAMGFCLVNNVAIAAAHARAAGAARVAIVDWDVHHGNGTQEMFYDDPSVLFVSLHQYPFYPGTGAADEVGSGDGRGYTVNVPLSAGADDAVYSAACERLIAPILNAYDPDLLLISAGYDAHRSDPLASMRLSEGGYARMLRTLQSALPRGPEGRLGLVLEGGYDLEGLRSSVAATLEALGKVSSDPEPHAAFDDGAGPTHEHDLARARRALAPYWKLP
ncbi:MAG TPA: histone deacetylase [Polyangiaceae bacterium]